jgi:hypothetical protein
MSTSFDLELPAGEDLPAISRADITFYGLDHSGPSYEARVFFDQPDASAETAPQGDGYVGSFSVLGHGGCFGEDGHCEVRGPVTTFDRRLPHQLVPATRVLICTDGIKRLIARQRAQVTVTVVALVRATPLAEPGSADDVLRFDQVSLHTYE